MKSMHLLLNDAEREWRGEIRSDFPLRSDTPVIKNSKVNGRDWIFSTDLKSIFADISNDEALQRKFETVVSQYWEGDPEVLAKETLHYLLYHELYHPIEAPFSVSGDDNDNKRIHQAIRRGVIQAEPKLSPLEQVVKVQLSQNGVKDFILDNRFAIDNKDRQYVQDDIIPTWDLLELHDNPSKTNFYSITRFLYGLFYGPESTHDFFREKAGKDGASISEKALSALIGTPSPLPEKKKKSFIDRAKALFGKTQEDKDYEHVQEYVKAVREVFSGDDRYKGIERFMTVLGHYVEKDMPQGRPDMQGEGSGTSTQSILQDLLDDMTPEEQEQFVQELAQESPDALEQAASEIQQALDSKPGAESSDDEMKNLDLLSTHEFYKRNHPEIKIVGGNKVGESVVVGKREYWALKKSTVLTKDQLGRLNFDYIARFQRKTSLPMLIPLEGELYRLNEYDLKEKDIKDIKFVEEHLDVPDVVEFYIDSSGSMFNHTAGKFNINDGSRWDMLSHVLYGFIDALQQGGKQVGKQTKIRIHNFGNTQVSSELIPVDQFWKGDTAMLETLFKPQNGYDKEDIDISKYNDGQRRTYVVVTDGELVIDGRTERESRKMKEFAQDPNNEVVLFEIGGTYDLGRAVKNESNIVYHPVHDKDRMLQAGLEVLLSKTQQGGHFS